MPPAAPLPGAQELGLPAEPREGQLSAEATAEASSPVSSSEELTEDLPASHNSSFSERPVQLDSSDGEDAPVSAGVEPEAEPATVARQLSEAHEGAAAQPNAGLADNQWQHDEGRQQPAYLAAPEKNAQANWDQEAGRDPRVMQRYLQVQADALTPVLRMLAPLSMLAARLMPAGKLQYSKVCMAFRLVARSVMTQFA